MPTRFAFCNADTKDEPGQSDFERTILQETISMPKLTCEGWWEQVGFGRQPMSDLVMNYESGSLCGSGTDVVGDFELTGKIDSETIYIRKQYVGKHSIDYHGSTHGEGVYFGDWSSYGLVGGKWSICVRRVAGGGPKQITPIQPT